MNWRSLVGSGQEDHQLFLAFAVEVPGEAESVASLLQGADGLLEGFLVILADAHDLADGPHLGAELVLYAFEFLESPNAQT